MSLPPRRVRGGFIPLATALLLPAALSSFAYALPPGRAWSPLDTLRLPQFNLLAGPRLETDITGVPTLYGVGRNVGVRDAVGFRWSDSSWTVRWFLGMGTDVLPPVPSPPTTQFLVWRGAVNTADERTLFLAEVFEDHVGEPDTVAQINRVNFYSAAVSEKRRWAVVGDQTFLAPGLQLFVSEERGDWREVEVPWSGRDGVAVASLDDTTALVASADLDNGLRWGVLRGVEWFPGPEALDGALANQPQFRPRPSGGQWLAWGSRGGQLVVRSFEHDAWGPADTVRCAPLVHGVPLGDAGGPDMSRDDVERPVLAWNMSDQRTAIPRVCVAFPTESGWADGDEIEQSTEGIGPTVARDRNGDAWVAFWRFFTNGIFWTHTYTKATSSTPTVEGTGRARTVRWTLSEPAPETWWAVLRARGQGPFEEVARVRAGATVDLEWVDRDPPRGVLRYRIRRESVDRRYQWLSPAVQWPERARGPTLRLHGTNPLAGETLLVVQAAAPGRVALEVYDLRGRRVVHEAVETRSTEQRVPLGLARHGLGAGIYFARVVDDAGRASPAVKLVVLR